LRRAPLHLERRPRFAQRRRQAAIAVDDRERRQPEMASLQLLNDVAPRGGTLIAGQVQVDDDPLPIGAHAHRHQHRDAHATLAQPHLRIPAVEQQIANLIVGQVPRPPAPEVLRQTVDQPPHRVRRQRAAAQQRRQGRADAPAITPREVDAENRFVDARRAPLVGRQHLATPLHRPGALADPCRAGRQRPGPDPVPIPA